jgi:transposase
MIDLTKLVGVVSSRLSALVIEGVEDAGEAILVRARTRGGAVACPGCGTQTSRNHGLRRGLVYATGLIDAQTGRHVDVVPSRTTDAAETWLRERPGAEFVTRDGSGAYGEAARRALPHAVASGLDLCHDWSRP